MTFAKREREPTAPADRPAGLGAPGHCLAAELPNWPQGVVTHLAQEPGDRVGVGLDVPERNHRLYHSSLPKGISRRATARSKARVAPSRS